ncbi:MAG: hypothetical protein IKM09_05270 [Clostridia bacterium]|nr:hypothetical protein [Clostridia bacterium]
MKKVKIRKENIPVAGECVSHALAFPERGGCMAELFEKRDVFTGASEKINGYYAALSEAFCGYAERELCKRYAERFSLCETARERCAMRPYRLTLSVRATSLPEENGKGVISVCAQYTLTSGAKTLKSVTFRENWNARHGFIYTRRAFLRLLGKKGRGAPYFNGAELMFDILDGRKI